jgi:hypothetical protein
MGTTPVELSNKEMAVVMMERRPDAGEMPFTAAADYSGDITAEDHSEGMRIIPGFYDIDIFLMTKEKIVIPKDEVCGEILGIEFSCQEIKAIEFGEDRPLFSGGVRLENVPLTAGALRDNDIIVFRVISVALEDTPSKYLKHKDIEKITAYEDLSDSYRRILLPTYEIKEDEIEGRGNITDII